MSGHHHAPGVDRGEERGCAGGTGDGDLDRGYDGVTGMPLADEAEMFRSVVLGSPDAVFAVDADGTVLWANPAAERLFGRPVDDLVGTPVLDLALEEERPRVLGTRRRLLEGDEVHVDVVRCRRQDGVVFDAAVTRSVRRAADGRVLGMSIVLSDVTEERRVRGDLTEALARSHARFDQVATPQALLDLEARFVAVNDAACALLGRERERLLGLDATGLVAPVDLARTTEQLTDLREGRVESVTYEVTAERPDATPVPLLIDASLVRDRDGTPREIAVFARDLSEVRDAQRRVEAQKAFFTALYRSATDVVVVTDSEDRVTYVSPSFTRVLGYPPDRVLGSAGELLLDPEDTERSRAHRAALRARPGGSARRLARVQDVRGRWRWFDAVTTNCLDDPTISGMVSNLRDVTSEIEAQQRLKESEARYRAIVETAQEGIVAVGTDGQVLFANDTMARLMGVPLETVYGSGLRDALAEGDAHDLHRRVGERAVSGPERYEVGYDHPDGTHRTWSVAASPLTHDDGSPMGSLGMIADVTVERQAEAELRHAALHDALTGLPNRALLVDRIAMAGARQQRDPEHSLAVMFLDLDHFKLVNDSRGHEVGDRLLVEVAARLEAAVRESDTVARLGGDEFAVICEGAGEDDAAEVARRIRETLGRPVDLGGEQFYVSASIGVALSPPHGVSDLLRFADVAMYDAKLGGRSRVATFRGGETGRAARRLAIATVLRETLADGCPTLGYQPVVDVETRQLVGLEALLRWEHPTLGAVSPVELLTAAETSGLSFDLDRAVILQAGADLVRLRQAGLVAGSVGVAVNISPRTAQQQRLDGLVREMLEVTGLPARCLTLEITEHAIMDNADHAVALMGRLAEAGVRIAIDDFGTGYNSLVHLQRLPVAELKIDRSFVRDVVDRPASQAIARSVVSLARALGMQTVAEGIETEAQVRMLAGLGCARGQGFLWGQAAALDDLPALFEKQGWTRG
ncbi:MAG: sensor domain-containing protein [Nocardioidaceae bacterium]